MARIHGLLYISGAALSMDDIMARLGISRGNVSMNLSKLVEWGLVRRVHKRGDRRDYYQAQDDVFLAGGRVEWGRVHERFSLGRGARTYWGTRGRA